MLSGEITYDNRRFVGIVNYDDGDFNRDTIFHYRQLGNIVWGTFQGGGILFGTLVGIVGEDGYLDLRWQCVNAKNVIMAGYCESSPELLDDGRVRIHERWRVTEGGTGDGESVLEELIERG